MPNRDSRDRDELFYESLPATFDQYQVAPAADEPDTDDRLLTSESSNQESTASSQGRITAVITLLLVALVGIILAILFLRGLDAIKSTVPSQSNSSGSLEL